VSVVDLDAASSVIRPTNISFRDAPRPAAISPSGRRLATFQAGSLAVHDIDSGQIVTATKLEVPDDSWWRVRLGFISDDRLRVYVLGERLAAHEYDVAARSVTSWSGPPLDDSYHELEWRADHTRLILQGRGSSGSTLIDGSQGLPILRLSDGGEPADSRPAFLADGRVVRFVHSLSGHARLELLSSDGVALQSYDLDGVERSNTLRLGAEVAPGTLSIVIDSRKCRLEDSARLLLVDLDSGRVREVPGGGRSLGRAFWRVDSSPEQPGSVASRLIYRDRSVWLLDPETLTVRLVAGPG
jgi:hypothetical protein